MNDNTGERIHVEQAFHVGERQAARRRPLSTLKKAATVIAGAAVATTVLTGIGNAIEQNKKSGYNPDHYYGGNVEVVMNDNLNLRENPVIISDPNTEPNTVRWGDVEEIKSNGDNWVKIKGSSSFVIQKPLITEGDSPEAGEAKGSWITLDAKVDQPFGDPKEEVLYVSFSGPTRNYVKPIESGTLIPLNPAMPTDNLGTVTVNP